MLTREHLRSPSTYHKLENAKNTWYQLVFFFQTSQGNKYFWSATKFTSIANGITTFSFYILPHFLCSKHIFDCKSFYLIDGSIWCGNYEQIAVKNISQHDNSSLSFTHTETASGHWNALWQRLLRSLRLSTLVTCGNHPAPGTASTPHPPSTYKNQKYNFKYYRRGHK